MKTLASTSRWKKKLDLWRLFGLADGQIIKDVWKPRDFPPWASATSDIYHVGAALARAMYLSILVYLGLLISRRACARVREEEEGVADASEETTTAEIRPLPRHLKTRARRRGEIRLVYGEEKANVINFSLFPAVIRRKRTIFLSAKRKCHSNSTSAKSQNPLPSIDRRAREGEGEGELFTALGAPENDFVVTFKPCRKVHTQFGNRCRDEFFPLSSPHLARPHPLQLPRHRDDLFL